MTTDCDKFDPLLLDELYEELDELTSAALKRHVSGCARCKASLDGMRATRSLVSIPLVETPEGLEDRILSATKEAQKVVPIKSRFSRALSAAGSWAMRPQTAMAAVFLLMIGSSAFLFSSRAMKRDAASESAVSVTVAGAPEAVATVSENERLDDKSAAAAHGPIAAPPAAMPAATASALAMADEGADTIGRLESAARKNARDDDSTLGALGAGRGMIEEQRAGGGYGAANAAAPAGAPPSPEPYAQAQSAPAPARAAADQKAQDPFSLGTAAYRARNYAEATRQFDAAAKTGNPEAALWAARATKEGRGCAAALGRFEAVAQQAAGTWQGNQGSLEAAKCQIAMGQLDPARDRLNKLAQVPSHASAAKQALAELDQVAARQQGGHVAGGSNAAPKAAAAPAKRAVAKPQERAADSESGF